MPVTTSPRLLVVLIAVIIVLGVGVATFFLGSQPDAQPTTESDYVDLDLGTIGGSSTPVEDVLYLPWGSGPADASRKGEPTRRSTIEAVFSSGDFVFVVDHPEGVYGARVRWFSAQGVLVGTRLAPPGSTFFRAQPGGYNYVVAKSGGHSETAVIVDVEQSLEATFTVPLQMNSGGLFWSEGTLYAQVAPSDVDFDEETMSMRFALIPVAVNGVQVDDAAADAGVEEVWGFGLDGLPYTSVTRVDGLDVISSPVSVIVGSGERRVRVPQRYHLLGVTADSRICLTTTPPLLAPTERISQASAAWNSSHDPFDEVLFISLDGTIDSSIVFPYSSVAARYDDTVPISLCDNGLYTLRADEGGVTVVAYLFE